MCRKWLWNRCRGSCVANCSHDQYDKLCLQNVNVDTNATSSVFPVRPSATAVAAAAAAVAPDVMYVTAAYRVIEMYDHSYDACFELRRVDRLSVVLLCMTFTAV